MADLRTTLLLALLLPAVVLGQDRLNAFVEAKRFDAPGIGERVDVNITIVGSSAEWRSDERGFQQAEVQALTMVEQGDKIVDYRKTLILSPERADTAEGDFLHQEHFLLKPGEYALRVELDDMNDEDTTKTYVHVPLVIPLRSEGISLSDIEFTARQDSSVTDRSSIPFTGSYFPPETDKLGFYAEVYGTLRTLGAAGPFIVVSQIEDFETKHVVGGYRNVQRATADTVVPVGLEFNIKSLPSGNYLLALEVRDRHDSLLARQEQFFQRNNPMANDPDALKPGQLGPNFTDAFTNADTLAEYLSSMRPVADDMEQRMIDDRWKDKKLELMQQFMYTFWYDRSPEDPRAAWEKYRQVVVYVNKEFGCRNMRGYQSDQGYAYLRYGAPNTVVDRTNETGVTPYMIWHYYRAGKYTNRRFVFIQPERSTTCWTLLTSDIPGEMNNPNWLDEIVPGMADGGDQRNQVQNNYNNPR